MAYTTALRTTYFMSGADTHRMRIHKNSVLALGMWYQIPSTDAGYAGTRERVLHTHFVLTRAR